MVSAMPFMNPTRIGRDRKSASTPSFRKLAPMHSTPARKASVSDSAMYSCASPAASGATEAATSVQVAASGPTTSWREEPNSA